MMGRQCIENIFDDERQGYPAFFVCHGRYVKNVTNYSNLRWIRAESLWDNKYSWIVMLITIILCEACTGRNERVETARNVAHLD